jgi:hypothetical protein
MPLYPRNQHEQILMALPILSQYLDALRARDSVRLGVSGRSTPEGERARLEDRIADVLRAAEYLLEANSLAAKTEKSRIPNEEYVISLIIACQFPWMVPEESTGWWSGIEAKEISDPYPWMVPEESTGWSGIGAEEQVTQQIREREQVIQQIRERQETYVRMYRELPQREPLKQSDTAISPPAASASVDKKLGLATAVISLAAAIATAFGSITAAQAQAEKPKIVLVQKQHGQDGTLYRELVEGGYISKDRAILSIIRNAGLITVEALEAVDRVLIAFPDLREHL